MSVKDRIAGIIRVFRDEPDTSDMPQPTGRVLYQPTPAPYPLLQGVHVEPVMAFGEAIRFNLTMRFITVEGEREIFLGASTDGNAMNALADDIRRELGMF